MKGIHSIKEGSYSAIHQFFGKDCLGANKSMVELTLYLFVECSRFESNWFWRRGFLSEKIQKGIEEFFKFKEIKHEYIKTDKKKHYVEGDVIWDHNGYDKKFAFILKSNNTVCFKPDTILFNIANGNGKLNLYQLNISRAVKWSSDSVYMLYQEILTGHDMMKLQLIDGIDIGYSMMDTYSLKQLKNVIIDRNKCKVLNTLYLYNISADDDKDNNDSDAEEEEEEDDYDDGDDKDGSQNVRALCDLVKNCSSFMNLMQIGFKNYVIDMAKIKLLIDAYFEHLSKLYMEYKQIDDVIVDVVKDKYDIVMDKNVVNEIHGLLMMPNFWVCIANPFEEKQRKEMVDYYMEKIKGFDGIDDKNKEKEDDKDGDNESLVKQLDSCLNGLVFSDGGSFDSLGKMAFVVNDAPLHKI